MTEADALARARALLAGPAPPRASAFAALAIAALMAILAAGLVGVTVAAPSRVVASASD